MIQPEQANSLIPSQAFQTAAVETAPASYTEAIHSGEWERHKLTVGAMRLRGFSDNHLHAMLSLHKNGIMTDRANGATTRDGTPVSYTRDHLEEAGLVDAAGGLTELGAYTLHFLENPRKDHLWKHKVSDVLQAYIDARKPRGPAPAPAL